MRKHGLPVKNAWRHRSSATKDKTFRKKTILAGLLRWIPRRPAERVTDDRTGWAPFEDVVEAMANKIPPAKRSPDLTHPARAWRELCDKMDENEKVRFDVLWYKPDLKVVGFKNTALDVEKCVDSRRAMEITPVAIRAAVGHEFRLDIGWEHVTTIEPGRLRLFFTKL